jgi:tRNA-Thr(GGU) m(6)t(6)A37 methyltransferase TsaA
VVYELRPIGVIRSPFSERMSAPRQSTVGGAADIEAHIELLPGQGYEHALEGLERWDYLWVIYVFHKNVEQERGWRPKVLPPRSDDKLGVFATRSPHRPNPLGLSATRLERIDGLVVHVRGLDALDGSPVLDLKPYVAYADAHSDAGAGWLAPPDPVSPWRITFDDAAREADAWLSARGVPLRSAIEAALALGPRPQPYRRIRENRPSGGPAMTLALKEWRVDFDVDVGARTLAVRRIRTGYRARDLAIDERLELHRSFAALFG